jgi:hypothetical protein
MITAVKASPYLPAPPKNDPFSVLVENSQMVDLGDEDEDEFEEEIFAKIQKCVSIDDVLAAKKSDGMGRWQSPTC